MRFWEMGQMGLRSLNMIKRRRTSCPGILLRFINMGAALTGIKKALHAKIGMKGCTQLT